MPVKSENPSGWLKSDFGNFFYRFIKARNYYPVYHINRAKRTNSDRGLYDKKGPQSIRSVYPRRDEKKYV